MKGRRWTRPRVTPFRSGCGTDSDNLVNNKIAKVMGTPYYSCLSLCVIEKEPMCTSRGLELVLKHPDEKERPIVEVEAR